MMPAETLQAAFPTTSPESRLVALAAPDSIAAEQYRVLHQRLLRIGARRPLRTVAVTSAGRGEGRTTTAANLALTAAQDGRSVILVEADLRRPVVQALFGLAPRPGLGDVVAGTAELGQATARVGTLSVLCAGDGRDPAAVARSPRASAVLDELRAAFELVVLDAPPALAFTDGDRIAGGADGALLVIRAGMTPRQVVRLALETLGDRAVGIVMNDVDTSAVAHARWIYGEEAEPPAAAAMDAG